MKYLDILHVQALFCENCRRFPSNPEPHTESQISLRSGTPHRIADFHPIRNPTQNRRFPSNPEPHTESQISLQSGTSHGRVHGVVRNSTLVVLVARHHYVILLSPRGAPTGVKNKRYKRIESNHNLIKIRSLGADLILIRLHVKYPSSSNHCVQKV